MNLSTVIDRIFECNLEKHIDVLFVEYHCRFFEDRDFYKKKQDEQVKKLSKYTDVTIWH